MVRLSITTRQALAKLLMPMLLAACFGLMLLGKADALLVERGRMLLADTLAPLYALLSGPVGAVRGALSEAGELFAVLAENGRLRAENDRLRQWQALALTLDAENQRLRDALHWIPDPEVSFVTARVVNDAGGVYARAVLLSVGPGHSVAKGQVALDERGLVGRVTEVGARTARVLLITDLNSRIPVTLENSRGRAILVGTNGLRPRLQYWPEESPPEEGERVVTSAVAGAFPANLPVGTVHLNASKIPEVEPAGRLDRVEILRIFDYGLGGGPAAEAPARTLGAKS